MGGTWTARYLLPSVPHAGDGLVQDLLQQMHDRQWSNTEMFGTRLALEEALGNAMEHGHAWNAVKQVDVLVECSRQRVRIEVIDQGSGFDPSQVPDPRLHDRVDALRGRGLLLIRSYMTRVEHADAGRRLVLEKHRSRQTNVA